MTATVDKIYQEFIQDRKANNAADKTIEHYDFCLQPFIEWAGDQPLDKKVIRSYRAHIRENGYSAATLRQIAVALKTFAKFAAEEEYIPEPIEFDLPKAKRKKQPFLNKEQIMQVLKVCGPRDKAIFLLMLDTGMRRSEIINLKWDDVDLNRVLVREPKNGNDRYVFISELTFKTLMSLPNGGEYIFDLTGSGVLSMFKRLSAKSGVKVRPHDMRRTKATQWLINGGGLEELRRIMGHANIEQTAQYTYLITEHIEEAHARFSPVANL